MILCFILESARKYLEYEKKNIAIFIFFEKVKVKEKTGNKIVCESAIFPFNVKRRLKHKGPLLQAISMPWAGHTT